MKLTYVGAAIFSNDLEAWGNGVIKRIYDEYENDDIDYAEEQIQEWKSAYPQRFKTYEEGNYYEDDFDFIMDILMGNMVYNKSSFANIFCYIGDGNEDKCWFEIIED